MYIVSIFKTYKGILHNFLIETFIMKLIIVHTKNIVKIGEKRNFLKFTKLQFATIINLNHIKQSYKYTFELCLPVLEHFDFSSAFEYCMYIANIFPRGFS